jgi:mono/diheme cytochrome c family protein
MLNPRVSGTEGLTAILIAVIFTASAAIAQNSPFHNAPPSTKEMTNPDAGDPKAAAAGRPLYHLRCARCHGERGEGSGNIPSIARGKAQSVSDGELFWFITKGDVPNRDAFVGESADSKDGRLSVM